MKQSNFLSAIIILTVFTGGILGFQAFANASLVPILECTIEPDGDGDRADLRGIRFYPTENFKALEIIMTASVPGTSIFTAEVRQSSGFAITPIRTMTKSVEFQGNGIPVLVHLDFQEVQASEGDVFTLKFSNFYPPDSNGFVYFEVIHDDEPQCPDVEETNENTGSNPTVRWNDPWLRVLGEGDSSELSIYSNYVMTPPDIDGSIGFGEWPMSNKLEFENGFLTVVNDTHRLYVLVDVLEDSDPDDGDYFWLTFDVNRDGEITPDTDIQYATNPSNGNLGYQIYNGPGSWTGLQPETYSSMGKGYGCFFGDGTLFVYFNPLNVSCSRHRVWEFGIDLAEIGAKAGGNARMGLRVGKAPGAYENIPENFTGNFTNLIEVALASSGFFSILPYPSASISLNQGQLTDAVEVSQAIQTRNNTLPLVEDKKTVARVYSQASSTLQPGIVSLYGSQNGVQLPGSPLAAYHHSPTSIDREDKQDTANFVLPKTWPKDDVTFKAVTRDLFGRASVSPNINLSFTPTETPTYWTIPLNTGTAGSPSLPDEDDMDEQEAFLEAMYPFPDVKFVRKSWEGVGVTSVSDAIDDLNYHYSLAVLAWILSGFSFDMPDQMFGFTVAGGGLSDPLWDNGLGRVARGGSNNESIMAHEIIHNLGPGDCDKDGRDLWGRHVSNRTSSMANGYCIDGDGTVYGCGASGADAGWQDRFDDGDIHEVGVDTSVTPFRLVPADKPDVMSYCEDTQLPSTWVSDYRWGKMVNHFNSASVAKSDAVSKASLMARVQQTIYISGMLYINGDGVLKPSMVQPGIPTSKEDVIPGNYAVELWSSGLKKILLDKIHFAADFTLDTAAAWVDESRDRFSFNFFMTVPDGTIGEIRLTHTIKEITYVLDTIEFGLSLPTVEILAPQPGDKWKGEEAIKWAALDNDGDALSFSLLYSPDWGKTWIPIAPRQNASMKGEESYSFMVDTTTLPAGPTTEEPTAMIRVIASDGYNTSQADSELFFLAPNRPNVSILSPGTGQTFVEGELIRFHGTAQDQEDGIIPEEQMIWSYNQSQFGTSSEFEAALPFGTHEVRLAAVDSDDMAGQDSVLIHVVPICRYDTEPDQDVDGKDLWAFARALAECQKGGSCASPNLIPAAFAQEFGKTGCMVEPQ